MSYQPPYAITPEILALVERIGEALGRLSALSGTASLAPRRANRIRALRGSLAIEGNTLTEGEISTILDTITQSDQVSDQVARLLECLRDGPKNANDCWPHSVSRIAPASGGAISGRRWRRGWWR